MAVNVGTLDIIFVVVFVITIIIINIIERFKVD